jgi:hypothetical protein
MPEFTNFFGSTAEEIIKNFMKKTFFSGVFIILCGRAGALKRFFIPSVASSSMLVDFPFPVE